MENINCIMIFKGENISKGVGPSKKASRAKILLEMV